MHFHGLAKFFLINRFGLERENRWFSNEHFHRRGTTLRAVGVIRSAGISSLMILIDSREQQGAVVHYHDFLRLIRLEQSLVLRPRYVL